jgi:uncharacterized membrane protein
MRFEIRDRPYDLYAVLGASTLLVLIILIFPGLDVARIILGLPFILFFPGYVLICALYPGRKRFFDSDGNEVDPPADDEGDTDEEGGYGNVKGSEIKGKGLDGLERIALSLGLSIAITPLIGLILNYTYDWAPDTLGIRLVPILVSQYAFILIVGIVALVKRGKVPPEDRFAISLDLSFPEDHTRTDKALTIGIVIMMVLSVGMLVYIIVVPRQGESFTEFYILGPNHKAEGYPRNLYIEESQFILIGIGNHEHRTMNYTLVMTIDGGARNNTVDTFDDVTISRSRQPSMEISVEDDSTLELQCNFSILEEGSYKLRFLLFHNGKEYRDLHMWVKVFQAGYLKRANDNSLEFFLAGEGGDPILLPSFLTEGAPLQLSIGARNLGIDHEQLNITFKVGDAVFWSKMNSTIDNANIDLETGAFYILEVNSTSSRGPVDLRLFLPEGMWALEVDLRYSGGTMNIVHNIEVEGV